LTGNPVAAGELARRANLGRTTIYPALEGLERTGVVEFVGVGAQRQARFRKRHVLGRQLFELFVAEARRMEVVVADLREIFKQLDQQPIAAWLEAPNDEQSGDETVPLWIVADPRSVALITDSLSERITEVEKTLGVHFDIRGLTRSELEARAAADAGVLREATLLSGVPPTALIPTSGIEKGPLLKSHAEHDVRGRRLAVAIAAKIKWDPSLVDVASRHVRKRMTKSSAGEQKELKEWIRVLETMPPAKLRQFLIGNDERSNRLRQTLPALGLLTPVERERVLASGSDEEARAAVLGR